MARQFTFRFDTMLRLRQQREDEHKRIVASRLREIGDAKAMIDELHNQIEAEVQAIRVGQSPGNIDLQQTVRHRHWLGHLHRTVLETEAKLRGLEARLAQERSALAEAAKQRRILEKLKDRQKRRHQMDEDRAETREDDEMATMRFHFERGTASG